MRIPRTIRRRNLVRKHNRLVVVPRDNRARERRAHPVGMPNSWPDLVHVPPGTG